MAWNYITCRDARSWRALSRPDSCDRYGTRDPVFRWGAGEEARRKEIREKGLSGSQRRSARSGLRTFRQYLVGAHHFVVFVFEDVAVPDVAAGVSVEGDDNAGDHGGVGADGVFPSHLFRRGRLGGSEEVQRALGLVLGTGSKGRRSRIWKRTKWRWMGWASSVRLTSSHISVVAEDGLFGDGRVPKGCC